MASQGLGVYSGVSGVVRCDLRFLVGWRSGGIELNMYDGREE